MSVFERVVRSILLLQGVCGSLVAASMTAAAQPADLPVLSVPADLEDNIPAEAASDPAAPAGDLAGTIASPPLELRQNSRGVRAARRIELSVDSGWIGRMWLVPSNGGRGLFIDSRRLGRLWFGRGDTASIGASRVDLSGTGRIGHSGVADAARSLAFRTADDTAAVPVRRVFSNFNGLARGQRVRYDTPGIHGFTFAASALRQGGWDAAMRYGGRIGRGASVAAAIGLWRGRRPGNPLQFNGSASMLLDGGFNLTVAAGFRSPGAGDRDPRFLYGKLGYQFDIGRLFDIGRVGRTAVAFDFTKADDIARRRDTFRAYGAFLVQTFDRTSTRLYLGVRSQSLDRPGQLFTDLLALRGGLSLRF